MAAPIECPQLLEIDTGGDLWAHTFTANGDYLVVGCETSVRVWRLKDGKRVATIPANTTFCVAASSDGRWIAGGSCVVDEVSREPVAGEVLIWNTTTYEQVFAGRTGFSTWDIDFSPDSTRLVSADSEDYTATIWNVTARQKVRTLDHDRTVTAAKYSSQGDRIATSTYEFVRVWDSDDGRLLLNIKVPVKNCTSLLWCKNHLFVQTYDGNIQRVDAATGSTISEWSVPHADPNSCIAVPQHGKFIAHSTRDAIAFWDTATHTLLGFTTYGHGVYLFAFSLDDSLLAVALVGSKVVVKKLFRSISEPELDINDATLDAWKHGQLTDAEALLSAALPTSENKYRVLASRALVRARLKHWNTALVDANESVEIQRSHLGYIAKCVALVGKGEKDSGCRVCEIASLRFPSDHLSLLLIRAVVLFMGGDHVDAISRVDDLIVESTDLTPDPALYVVQAHMHLHLANKLMEEGDYEHAIQLLQDGRTKLSDCLRQPPLIISLISGWTFDDLVTTIGQSLCEALFVAGRVKVAAKSVLRMLDEKTNMTEPIKAWVTSFKYRCRSRLEDLGDTALNAKEYHEAISQYSAALSLDPADQQGLLMKRSNAWLCRSARVDALDDANEWVGLMLTHNSWEDALNASVGFMLEKRAIHRALCDHLEWSGRVTDAIACFREISREPGQERDEGELNWPRDFKFRCCDQLEHLGDSAMNVGKYDEAVSQYTTALSLDPTSPQDLLVKRGNALVGTGARKDALKDAREWATLTLTSNSWKEALATAACFMPARFTVYRAVCEHLETTDRITDAVACFHQMSSEVEQKIDGDQANWTRDFRSRYCGKLKELGDSAMNAKQYDAAILQYTAELLLGPTSPQDILVKRSKAYAEIGKWDDALNDANEVIKLDSSSLLGYERKYAALLGMGQLDGAIEAFDSMLSKMSHSPDSDIRERSRHQVRPEETMKVIRACIKDAIRDSPSMLINSLSGRLCDKSAQAAAFESTPAFAILIRSMTTHIDRALIQQTVRGFYRYATLSHTWEGNEPLYEKVIETVVYNLEGLPTHEKLQMFCKVVREEGFHWAWSDTCCIDKVNHFVLQEALVSMFKWYEGSAMTIIFLFDVDRLAELGALMKSLWNSRGWTLQEYHAAKVVRFYTKDWTPYLGLTIGNHKESPEIISEMEQATGVSAQTLMGLRPGLNDIREKLRLASTRQTTREEDAAYSLLGIFSMSMPITYGEGDKALGRLLSQLLTSSGDTSILAWTGTPGSFNSCLPTNIIAFSQPLSSYIPPTIPDAEIKTIAAGLRASTIDSNLVTRLFEEVDRLPTPTFAGQRMRLPCIAFKIRLVSRRRDGSEFVFRAKAGALGTVEIKTKHNFTPRDSLYLVHPWIGFLLDRRSSGKKVEIASEKETSGLDEFISFDTDLSSTSCVYEFLARLRQPFGALLLASDQWNMAEYMRVSTENLITVQVEEITSATLDGIMQGVRVLDVL